MTASIGVGKATTQKEGLKFILEKCMRFMLTQSPSVVDEHEYELQAATNLPGQGMCP